MSILRKAKRIAIKKNPMTKEQADKIINIETNKKTARELAEEYYNRKEENLKYKTIGEMYILICGWLRINCNFSRQNLQDFITDFTRFYSLANKEKTKFEDIKKLLKEEIDFDIEKEFKVANELIVAEENNETEIRKKIRRPQLGILIKAKSEKRMKKEDKRFEQANEISYSHK